MIAKCTIFVLLAGIYVTELKCNDVETDEEASDNWIVTTDSGPVEGTVTKDLVGEEVYVFYGIPYAEPPVGDLRFQPPKPVKPWTDTLVANKKPLPCYQQKPQGEIEILRKYREFDTPRRPWSEDCLRLNIWTPKPKPHDEPVLVFFHGGSFRTGSGVHNFMDGSTLAAQAKDLIVTMNYRLGAFGFLYLGIPDAPGNVGLMDQQLALKWVHENIHHFGGKQDAIILVGGAAGGTSVGYHLLSPGSAGLFKSATMVAGAPTCPGGYHNPDTALNKSLIFSARLDCDKDTPEETAACLRRVHPEDMVDASRTRLSHGEQQFKPTNDGTFITEPPLEAMKAGRFTKVVILAFTNSHEGSFFVPALNPDIMTKPDEGFDVEGFRTAVRRAYPWINRAAMATVEDHYLDQCDLEDHGKIRDAAIRVYSDLIVDCCVNQFSEYAVANGAQVFRIVDDLRQDTMPSWVGSYHMSTVVYIMGYPQAPDVYGFSPAEANMSNYFIQWINAKTRTSAIEVNDWLPLFTLEEKNYVYWDAIGPNYSSRYRDEHCSLWYNIIPALVEGKRRCNSE